LTEKRDSGDRYSGRRGRTGGFTANFADALRDEYPSTAQMFEAMREEEVGHRDRLFAMFRQRFATNIPLIAAKT